MTYVVFQPIRLGHALSNSEEKRFPFMVGMDLIIAMPFMAPVSFGLFQLRQGFKVKFLGTWISYFIVLLDVSDRSEWLLLPPNPLILRSGDEASC